MLFHSFKFVTTTVVLVPLYNAPFYTLTRSPRTTRFFLEDFFIPNVFVPQNFTIKLNRFLITERKASIMCLFTVKTCYLFNKTLNKRIFLKSAPTAMIAKLCRNL